MVIRATGVPQNCLPLALVHVLYPPPPAGTDPNRGELLGGNHWNPVTISHEAAANLGMP
jgi:hypothetical protein